MDLLITHKSSRHITVSGSKGNTFLGAVGRKGRGLSEGREVEGSRENRGRGSSGSTSTPRNTSNSLPIPPLVPGVVPGYGKNHAKNRKRRQKHKLARQGYFELVGEVGDLREKLDIFERREEEGQRVQAIEDRGRGGQSGEAKPPREGSRPHHKSSSRKKHSDRSEDRKKEKSRKQVKSEGVTQIFKIKNAWF